jgi:hypothetical protein
MFRWCSVDKQNNDAANERSNMVREQKIKSVTTMNHVFLSEHPKKSKKTFFLLVDLAKAEDAETTETVEVLQMLNDGKREREQLKVTEVKTTRSNLKK